MATRSERLEVHFQATGDGQVKASLAGVAQAMRGVDQAAGAAKAPVDNLGRGVTELGNKGSATATQGLGALNNGLHETEQAAQAAGPALGNMGEMLTRMLAKLSIGVLIVKGLTEAFREIAESQRVEAMLRTITGSVEGMNHAMEVSRQISRATAYSVTDLARGFAQLANNGLDPTKAQLEGIANLGAGIGKTFEEAAGAVTAAMAGHFRQLREYGIEAKEQGDDVAFTFRGVTTVVQNNAVAIQRYLDDIGNHDFAGAAARQAATLGGHWQQLKSAASDLASATGESGLGAVIGWLTGQMAKGTQQTAEMIRQFGLLRTIAGTMNPSLGFAMQQQMAVQSIGGDPYAALRDGARSATQIVKGLYDEIQKGIAKQAEAEGKANDEGKTFLDRLTKQKEVYGQSMAVAVEYAAQQAAAKVADKELAKAILDTAGALGAKIRAEEAARDKEKGDAEKERQRLARMRDEIALMDVYLEGVSRMRENLKAEEAEAKRAAETQERFLNAIEKIEGHLDPTTQKLRQLGADAKLVEQAFAAGAITLEKYYELLDKIEEQRADALSRGRLVDALAKATGGNPEDAEHLLDNLANQFGDSLYRALRRGFKDAGQEFETLLRGVADEFGHNIVQNQIIKPLQNWVGGGALDQQALMKGGAYALGTMGGSYFGGGGERAQIGAGAGSAIGALVGSIFPVIGTMLGSLVGGLLGGLVGGVLEKNPEFKAWGGSQGSNIKATAISPFGRTNLYTYGAGDGAAQQFAAAIAQFDGAIARLLSPAEIDRVKGALDGHLSQGKTPDAVLADRLNAIIHAVEPQWEAFLTKFTDVQSRSEAFAALRGLKTQLEGFDQLLVQIAGEGLAQLKLALTSFDDAVSSTAADLKSAIASQDPARIEQASSAAINAVVERYQKEIEMVRQLQDAIEQAAQQAYDLQYGLAQRIANLGGDSGAMANLAGARVASLQGQVVNEADAARAIGLLNTWIGTVDQWLSASTAQINGALQQQLAQLADERSSIMARAQARGAAASQAQAAAAQAAQAAHQAAIQALQEQLRLAQQWVQVLDRANQLQQQMQFGQENPLSGYGRLDALNRQIAAQMGGGIDALGSEAANQLIALLQQRLQLVTSGGLFDRPSDDYLKLYNETLALLDQVRGIAGPQADRAEELQQQIAALQQQTVRAVSYGTGVAAQLSYEEQARLGEIEQREKELKDEAQKQLDELNAQALDYYTWAQGKGQELEERRQKELLDQLTAISGGRPVDEFIAARQAEATLLLTDIRDSIRAFLASIGGTGAVGAQGGTGYLPGGGGSSDRAPIRGAGDVNLNVTINGSGMSSNELRTTIQREIVSAAGVLKRELRVA